MQNCEVYFPQKAGGLRHSVSEHRVSSASDWLREEHVTGRGGRVVEEIHSSSSSSLTGSAQRNLPLHLTLAFNGFELPSMKLTLFFCSTVIIQSVLREEEGPNKEQQLPGVNLHGAKPGAAGRHGDTVLRSSHAFKDPRF